MNLKISITIWPQLIYCLFFPTLSADKVMITILSINDVYEVTPKDGKGGFAPLLTLIEKERLRAPDSILTVNGDFLFPSLLSLMTKGSHMVSLFNDLGVDYVVYGNHEFDFGSEIVKQRMHESNFTWLGTNVLGKDGMPFEHATKYCIKEVNGIKIGFLGLCTTETETLSKPGKDVIFKPVIPAAIETVTQLKKEGSDLIIALTHLTFEEDIALAKAVPELTLILGGHEHNPITWQEGSVIIHKSGQDANYLVTFDLLVDKNVTESGVAVTVLPEWRMKGVWGVASSPKIDTKIHELEEKLDHQLAIPVGASEIDLDTRNLTVRSLESSMGNLFTDAMVSFFKADIAFINGGCIRGNKVYKAHTELSMKDIYSELPFGNYCMLLEIKGSVIKDALENGLSSPNKPSGRFPQVSGLKFSYDPEKPLGERVLDVEVQGVKLDPSKIYTVATIDHLYNGGDNYAMFKKGRVLVDSLHGPLLTLVIMDYISSLHGNIAPIPGRIMRKSYTEVNF